MRTKINWDRFLDSQKELDGLTLGARGLTYESTSKERVLALVVELNELANSTKSFKFWSSKEPDRFTMLEEYSDVFHFILSFMIEKDIDPREIYFVATGRKGRTEITSDFLSLITGIRLDWNDEDFKDWVGRFLTLGSSLGFEFKDIEEAFWKKRQINVQRQRDGY